MSKLLIFISCCLICFSTLHELAAQTLDVDRLSESDKDWNEGKIYLTSGETLTGLVKLNTKTGLLAFESGSTSKSFTPRSVISFEYFDAELQAKKSFISVTYKSESTSGKKSKAPASENGLPQFYEILIECKDFALLASSSKMNLKMNHTPGGYTNAQTGVGIGLNNSSTTYSQTESLLIFDAEGIITPVLDITHTEIDQTLFGSSEKTKSKKLDNSAIEKYTTPHFEELEEFVRERKLSFKRKDDLIRILEHYNSLSNN